MSGLRVVSAGALSSLQDLGRHGWRHLGVPASGVLDPEAMQVANRLVGNRLDAPVLETFDGGLCLRAEGGDIRIALVGGLVAERRHSEGAEVLETWRSHLLAEGEELRVLGAIGERRCATVAVAGIRIARQLGSAATYVRAGLGGLDGRNLSTGDLIPATPADRGRSEYRMAQVPPTAADGPIRLVAGPQDDHFAPSALTELGSAEYRVAIEADRMGMRLNGPPLAHRAFERQCVAFPPNASLDHRAPPTTSLRLRGVARAPSISTRERPARRFPDVRCRARSVSTKKSSLPSSRPPREIPDRRVATVER